MCESNVPIGFTREEHIKGENIDDRAICFEGDFGAVLWKLVRFTPYWQR